MTFDKVKDIIVENLGCDESEVTMEANLMDDLGADSLDLFELIMSLEEEYQTEIPSDDLQDLTTVGQVMDYLKAHGVEA